MTFTSFNTVSRIVHEWGCIQSLPEEISRIDHHARSVLIVSDPGIEAAGILERAASILSAAGLDSAAFSKVQSDPAFDSAEASIAFAQEYRPDVVVGIGGGSSLDIAKLTAALLTNPGPIDRYVGMELIEGAGVPLILIPTTAGTGSEVTSICVLSDTVNQVKKGIVSRHLFARMVLLDPELTVGLPPRITAMTGMDALVHAIESYTGKRATPFTDALNIGAIRIIAANLRRAFDHGTDRKAREQMLQASCMAGMAFSNTQNALDHALALAVGGRFHLPHGLLTAMMMPRVMKFNLEAASAKFVKIAEAFGAETQGVPEREGATLAVAAVRSLLGHLGISTKLSAYGIPAEAFPAIAKATVGAVRLISNNPRDVSEEEVIALLEETGEE
ncbi:MAG: iron-containing alcohol dehydrogenase [Deltaproteobacteria bacterium]|nr:iron-containing alcohol dehydrogenase [Deltaproteobacteria bacterium]